MKDGGNTGLCTTAVWLVSPPYGHMSHWTYVFQGGWEEDLRHTVLHLEIHLFTVVFFFFFQKLKVFWKLWWLELGFCHDFLCHLGQYIQMCSKGWKQANRSDSAYALSLWTWASFHLGPICPSVPMLTEILCFRRLQILFYLSDSSSRSYWPSRRAHTYGKAHTCVLAIQLPFPYLTVPLPLVRLMLRCWTVQWSSWCTSTSAEPDVGAVISGISTKQTAGGSKVWRGHN